LAKVHDQLENKPRR